MVTGGQDAKLKLWKTDDGFCFVTFTEHTAAITGVVFGPPGKQIVVSSSLDGSA